MANGVFWTSEDVLILLRNWGAEPFEDTAQRIGRSVDACKSKCSRILDVPGRIRRSYRMWTPKETIHLISVWGSEPAEKTAERLNRTKFSVFYKARELMGSASLKSRFTNQQQLEKILGHTGPHRITGLLKGLHIKKWGRTWLLTDDQVEIIKKRYIAYLNKRAAQEIPWSEEWPSCRSCNTDNRESTCAHRAQGLCKRCYARVWWRHNRGFDLGIEGISF